MQRRCSSPFPTSSTSTVYSGVVSQRRRLIRHRAVILHGCRRRHPSLHWSRYPDHAPPCSETPVVLRKWLRAYRCGLCAVVMGDLSGALQEPEASLSSPGPVVLVPFATNDCLVPVCPWCVLRATHGDVDSAGRQVAQAMSCGLEHQGQGHCDYIVMHALKWCQELCRSQSPLAATSSSGTVHGRTLTMGRQSMQLYAAPWPSPWQSFRHGATGASASSTQNIHPPPRRPRPPPPWFAWEGAAANSVWGPYAQPPPPPRPATAVRSLLCSSA